MRLHRNSAPLPLAEQGLKSSFQGSAEGPGVREEIALQTNPPALPALPISPETRFVVPVPIVGRMRIVTVIAAWLVAESVAAVEKCQLVEKGFGPQGKAGVKLETVVAGLEVPWG